MKRLPKLFRYILFGRLIRRIPAEKRVYFYIGIGALIIVLLPLVFGDLFFPHMSKAAWADENWPYRKSITIATHTATESAVFINLTGTSAVDTSGTGKFKANCGDLRFTNQGGEKLAYYIVSGCGSSNTVVHVFFDIFPSEAQTIYMYYGNLSATDGFSLSDFTTEATGYTLGAYGSEEKSPSPIGYWKLDEGQGTVASNSASSLLPAAFYNSPTWLPSSQCVSGSCMQFDGTNDYGAIDDTPALYSNSFSAGAWIKSNSWTSTGNKYIVSKREASLTNEWAISVTTAGKVEFFVWNGASTLAVDLVSKQSLSVNTWYYVVVSTDGTTPKIYINGVLDTSTSQSLTMNNTSSHIVFGRCSYLGTCNNESTRYFQGALDEVKYYNFALSSDQVKANYVGRGGLLGGSVLGASDQSYLTNGIVGYWKMDETSANTCSGGVNDSCDSSGNSNDIAWAAAAAAPTASASAKFGAGLDFESGSSQYGTAPDTSPLSVTGDLTIGAWIKPESVTAATQFDIAGKFDGANESYLLSQFGDEIRFYVGSSSNYVETSASNLTTNTWYYVVGVYNSKDQTAKIYINGVLATTTTTGTIPSSITDNAAVFAVGAEDTSSTPANFYDGVVDEVRVYNRAFGAWEVEKLYNFAPGPVGYWNFEEKKGITANDASGYGNTGTLTNSPQWYRGKYGGGIKVTQSATSYVSVADSPSLSSSTVTTSFWANLSSIPTGGTASLIYKNGAYSVDVNTSGQLIFQYNGGNSLTANTTLSPNTWYYITAIFDPTVGREYIYINGVLDKSFVSGSTGITDNANDLLIGTNSGNNRSVTGIIDEVKIYNYQRSAKQITEDMNGGHPAGGSPVGSAIGYWKFNDGVGNVASNSGSLGSILNAGMYNFSTPPSAISGWSNDGKFGKALNFDGSDDIVEAGSDSSIDDMASFSVSAWIDPRTAGEGSAGRIIEKASTTTPTNGWTFHLNSSNQLQFQVDYSSTDLNVVSRDILSLKSWSHVMVLWDGSTTATNVHIYINGKEVRYATQTDAVGTRVSDASEILRIGNDRSRAATFDGWIDDMKLYNYALSSSEVKVDFNHSSAFVLGAFGMSSTGVASNSASAVYCVPGDTTQSCAPVGEWRFEEKSGVMAHDTSGNNGDGTLGSSFSSAPTWTSGKVGSALLFGGVSSNVVVPDSNILDLTSNLSISVWVKRGSLGTTQHILNKGTNAYSLNFDTSNNVNLTMQGTGNIVTSSRKISDTTSWHHIVATWNGTLGRIYIDGVDVSGNTTSRALAANATNLTIGSDTSPSNFFNGRIDEVKIYNYALSSAQVAWDYNRGKPIVWYKMDECQGGLLHSSTSTISATLNVPTSGTQTSVGTCLTSGTAWGNGASGKYNSSVNFDGTDDYAVSQTIPEVQNTKEISVSVWVNMSSLTGHSAAVALFGSSSDKGYWIDVDANGSTAFWVSDDGSNQTAAGTGVGFISPGIWYHLVGTYSQSDGIARLYVNGLPKITAANINRLHYVTTPNAFTIGRLGALSADYFDGQVDDVQIFQYQLTATQIKTLYNQSSAMRFGPISGTP